jgi:hypothetical protein
MIIQAENSENEKDKGPEEVDRSELGLLLRVVATRRSPNRREDAH